ncbi:MAG: transmembrane domain-containing protein, partial [Planctomycetota bacterium]
MKIPMIAAGVVGGLLFLASGDLFGHGGTYRGPGDTVPPGEGSGPGTGGPGTGGPTTPGPGGPNTPGPGGGPVTPGGGVGGPGGNAGPARGPTTDGGRGAKKNAGGEGFEQWQFWWENNKDRYLDL